MLERSAKAERQQSIMVASSLQQAPSQLSMVNTHSSTTGVMIGLEVHSQLATRTKLFCACETPQALQLAPNTKTCPICLGHPGSKPLVNKKAVEFAIKIALGLECNVATTMQFSRKTYFYPDLAKNYQITQYESPLGTNGKIILNSGKIIRIRRVHVEEDPAGLIHTENFSLADYNRSGIPLVEIVTEPDMHTAEEAREFLKKLSAILTYLEVRTDWCVMKADVNVSIKERGFTRVEIKNVNGLKEVEEAIKYEIRRQEASDVNQETRQWDAARAITISLRSKETEADYGYIIDPDIPTITISNEWKEQIQKSIPELGAKKTQRFIQQFKLDKNDAAILASDPALATLLETLASRHEPVLIARWLRRDVLRILNASDTKQNTVTDENNELEQTILQQPVKEKTAKDINQEHLSELFTLLEQKKISDKTAQEIMPLILNENISPITYVKEKKLEIVNDDLLLTSIAQDVIKEQQQAVIDLRNGRPEAFEFLVGQIMRKTKGKAAPESSRKALRDVLEK